MISYVTLVILVQLLMSSSGLGDVVIKTTYGELRGKSPSKAPRVTRFLGVPYAGTSKRFEKATLPTPWKGVRDATQKAPQCYQYSRGPKSAVKMSEDCLTLDVYTPVNLASNTEKKAVMVYIHGGGFTTGNSGSFDASILSDIGDVVVVVIQYRLGIFGFFSTGGRTPLNIGLWDQKLALEWVRLNIFQFGGDNVKTTVFGESAGSMSISCLMASPYINRSFFQRAIMQSGSVAFGEQMKAREDLPIKLVAKSTNCLVNGSSDADIECLKSVSPDRLLPPELLSFSFYPQHDGDFLPHSVKDIFLKYQRQGLSGIANLVGNMDQYDAIIGFNGQEGQFLAGIFLSQLGDSIKYGVSEQMFREVVENHTVAMLSTNEQLVKKLSNVMSDQYLRQTPYTPGLTRAQSRLLTLIDLLGDYEMTAPTNLYSRLHSSVAKGRKSYRYYFDHKPENLWFLDIAVEGGEWIKRSANHADDVGFVIPYGGNRSKAEQDLSDEMVRYWTNFAKTGNPCYQSGRQTCQTWQPVSSESQRLLHITTYKDYMDSDPLNGKDEYMRDIWTTLYEQDGQKDTKEVRQQSNPIGRVIASAAEVPPAGILSITTFAVFVTLTA